MSVWHIIITMLRRSNAINICISICSNSKHTLKIVEIVKFVYIMSGVFQLRKKSDDIDPML